MTKMELISMFNKGLCFMIVILQLGSCDHLPDDFRGWKHLNILQLKELSGGTELISMSCENKHQCARMCWLYRSCTIFTFHSDRKQCRLTTISPTTLNLIPNQYAITVDMRNADVDKPRLHGCDHRNCRMDELCVPVGDPDSKRCLIIGYTKCSNPPPIVSNSDKEMDGVVSVKYICKKGYVKRGAIDTSTCDAITGRWSDIEMSCSFQECGQPPELQGAVRSGDETSYNSVIKYMCFDGWVSYSTDMTIRCQSNNKWSTLPQMCTRSPCSDPKAVENGVVSIGKRVLINPDPVVDKLALKNGLVLMYGSTAIHSCVEGFYAVIDEFRSECQMDGTWQSTSNFMCKPIDCGNPPSFPNAWMNYNLTTFESTSRYECLTGYENKTESSMSLSCLANGTWSGEVSACEIIDCGLPPAESNSTFVYSSTSYLSTANYSCSLPAFNYPNGNIVSRTCQSDGQWSNESVICIPCGKPNEFENSIFKTKHFLNEGYFIADYSCNAPFNLNGDNRHICNITKNNKAWTGNDINCSSVPKVNSTSHLNNTTTKGCENPPILSNAERFDSMSSIQKFSPKIAINPSETELRPGINITYVCSEGYKGKNNNSMFILQCSDDNKWTKDNVPIEAEEVYCIPVDCGSPPNVNFATIKHTQTTFKSRAQYVCDRNYIIKSGNTTNGTKTCDSDGKWHGEDIKCDPDGCGNPPSFSNAIPNYSGTEKGERVYYSCQSGFKTSRVNNWMECLDEWVGEVVEPVCSPIECGRPPSIEHASANFSKTHYGSIANYNCEENYEPKGIKKKMCNESGLWSGDDMFKCKEVVCGKPPNLINATSQNTNVDYYAIGSSVLYRCNDDSLFSGDSLNITCLTNGSWSQAEFECIMNNCGPVPEVKNSVSSMEYKNGTIQSAYSCNLGYFAPMSASMIVTCNSDNQWSNPAFICLNKTCENTPAVKNAISTSETKVEDFSVVVYYECSVGLQHWWFDIQTCNESGEWSNNSVECLPIDCGNPPDVKNAVKNFQATTFGSNVIYSCEKGYRSTNVLSKSCLDNGKWSEVLVECTHEQLICSPPPEDKFSKVDFRTLAGGSVIATYTCNLGYTQITKSYTRVCNNAIWEPSKYRCSPVHCPDAAPMIKQSFLIDREISFEFGSKLSYVCNEEFRMAGNGKKICSADGTWSRNIIECFDNATPVCLEPPEIKNTLIEIKSYVGEAVYSCIPGFVGNNWTISCINGIWGPIYNTSCKPVDCGNPKQLENTEVSVISTTFGSKAVYQCVSKYKQIEPSRSVCQHTGQWSQPPSACVPDIPCPLPLPTVPNATSKLDLYTPFPMLTFTCLPNNFIYGGISTHIAVCMPTGVWAPLNKIECHWAGDCYNPPNVTNSYIVEPLWLARVVEDITFFIKYGCRDGFKLRLISNLIPLTETSADLTCSPLTGWNITIACDVDCGPHPLYSSTLVNPRISKELTAGNIQEPYPSDDGNTILIHTNGTMYKSQAVIGCQSPFLGQKKISECQENGNWSGVNITCRQFYCDITPKAKSGNGYFSATTIDREGHTSTWRLVCNSGFQYLGISTLATCRLDFDTFEEMWTGLDDMFCVESEWTNYNPESNSEFIHKLDCDKHAYFDSIRICFKFYCSPELANSDAPMTGFLIGLDKGASIRITVAQKSKNYKLQTRTSFSSPVHYEVVAKAPIVVNEFATLCFQVYLTNATVTTHLNGIYFGEINYLSGTSMLSDGNIDYFFIRPRVGTLEFVKIEYIKLPTTVMTQRMR